MKKKIVVDYNGESLTWVDGSLTGKQALVEAAEFASIANAPVVLVYGTSPVEANLDDEDDLPAVFAAMVQASPYDAVLVEAPEEVHSFLAVLSEYQEDTIF